MPHQIDILHPSAQIVWHIAAPELRLAQLSQTNVQDVQLHARVGIAGYHLLLTQIWGPQSRHLCRGPGSSRTLRIVDRSGYGGRGLPAKFNQEDPAGGVHQIEFRPHPHLHGKVRARPWLLDQIAFYAPGHRYIVYNSLAGLYPLLFSIQSIKEYSDIF